jgi:hypothetical protein
MWNPENLRIACYTAWSGAEATFRFGNQRQYDAVRAQLDKIAKGHLRGRELPPGFSSTVTDYYFIEKKDRAAFQKIMRDFTT